MIDHLHPSERAPRVAAWLLGGLILLAVGSRPSPLPGAEAELRSVFPASCHRGESLQVTLAGPGVESGGLLYFSRPGVSGEHVKGNQYQVTASADTALGDCDVWLVTPSGLAGPRRFRITQWTVVEETEDNGTRETAQRIPLPACVEAKCDRDADVDWFQFEGRQGQTITIACLSASLDGSVQPAFTLIGPAGEELLHSGWERLEPEVTCLLPATGSYALRVHERAYRRDDYSQYRLELTEGPHLVGMSVPDQSLDATTGLRMLGYGLLDGELLVRTASHTRHLPSDLLAPLRMADLPAGTAANDASSNEGGWYRARWPATSAAILLDGYRLGREGMSGEVLVRPFRQATDGIHRERKDERADPQVVALPARVLGRFATRGDVDWYGLSARKGDVLHLEAIGERLGQWMDIELTVEDPDGKTVATFTDVAQPKDLPATLPLATLDPAGEWKVPADGAYRLAVRDLYGSSVFGPDRVYELVVRHQTPGFQVVAMAGGDKPGRGMQAKNGQAVEVSLVLVRRGGFDGPVTVRLADPIEGLEVEPLEFKKSEVARSLTVNVTPDAAGGIRRIGLVATAEVGENEWTEPVRTASVVRPGVTRRVDDLILSIHP